MSDIVCSLMGDEETKSLVNELRKVCRKSQKKLKSFTKFKAMFNHCVYMNSLVTNANSITPVLLMCMIMIISKFFIVYY